MSDLSAIYCFGPSGDRKSPLYVWGQSPSGVRSPAWGGNPPRHYDDGTKAFCKNLRAAMRWHTESFSFLKTRYKGYPIPTRKSWGLPVDPIPVGDDPRDDGYALVPIELNWQKVGGVAYHNRDTGVRITHFPVIHTRKGSMGYKLEWNGLSMIYTSDTRPEWNCVKLASMGDGVDVFIHEMILPPELLTMKNMRLSEPDYSDPNYLVGVDMSKTVIESSHSPQGAYGYLLSQINPHPRLSVIAHFPVANDTVACALNSVKAHCPWVVWDPQNPNASNLIWSTDLMVLRVKKGQIEQFRGQVSDYAYGPPSNMPSNQMTSKYHTAAGRMDPTAQLDLSTLIPQKNPDGTVNYCENGY
jgi:ribonuclease Z